MGIDPTGMSWLSDLGSDLSDAWHDLWHDVGHTIGWNHIRHQAEVNWDHGREDIEIAAAVAACVVVDIYAPELAGWTNTELASLGSTATVTTATCMEVSNAAICGIAGGFIGARGKTFDWQWAARGAMIGYGFGMTYDACYSGYMLSQLAPGGTSMSTFTNGFCSAMGNNLGNFFSPANDMGSLIFKGVGAGVVGMATGNGASTWNNFRDGMECGLLLGAFGYQFSPSGIPAMYLLDQELGELSYHGLTGNRFDASTPLLNGIGWSLF